MIGIKQHPIKLVLFFTRGVSLQVWHNTGMFEREIALYKRLQEKGMEITFITFGNSDDMKFSNVLRGINICCNRFTLPTLIYEKLIPLLHWNALKQCSLIKTNQTDGADLALKISELFNKPLIARCGYMWSEFAEKQKGARSNFYKHTLVIEKKVFSKAQHIVVTTPMMKEDILRRNIIGEETITVIPNYVLTDIFKSTKIEKDIDVLFIGRLAEQKNVEALIEAVSNLKINLTVIGQGSLKEKLREKNSGFAKITWIERVGNKDIPFYVNRAKIFILPSLYEGHPKTLIEAMACGAAVIGADSPGIREVIHHRETGLLCGIEPQNIAAAIQELLLNSSLREHLGTSARNFAKKEYALDAVVKTEYDLYQKTIREFGNEKKA